MKDLNFWHSCKWCAFSLNDSYILTGSSIQFVYRFKGRGFKMLLCCFYFRKVDRNKDRNPPNVYKNISIWHSAHIMQVNSCSIWNIFMGGSWEARPSLLTFNLVFTLLCCLSPTPRLQVFNHILPSCYGLPSQRMCAHACVCACLCWLAFIYYFSS